METEAELERRMEIAQARLGVAEELRWPLAGFCGLATYSISHSWLLAVAAGVAAFYLAAYWYDKQYEAASDAYERATGTGKYYTGKSVEALEQELEQVEEERQELIDRAATEGKTVSTERALAPVLDLREQYLAAGREDDVRTVDKMIADFREKYGSEIPIAEAYRLMKEIEKRFGVS